MPDPPRHAAPPPAPKPVPEIKARVAPYRPISPALRRWIVLLTLATVVGLPWLMIQPHLKLRAAKAARAEAAALAACPPAAASAAAGCPGSRMPVTVLPVTVLPVRMLPARPGGG